jgi:hypothetical protein
MEELPLSLKRPGETGENMPRAACGTTGEKRLVPRIPDGFLVASSFSRQMEFPAFPS